MAKYETSVYAQMRRCRMAQLYSDTVDEHFGEAGGAAVSGYVHSIRPELTSWPMRWTITIEPSPVESRRLALAG